MTFSSIISVPRPYNRDGAPSCGIYLLAPKKMQFKQFMVQLQAVLAALNSSPYQKNMHAVEFQFPEKIFDKEREQASILVGMCKQAGVVAIVRSDVGLCVECGADGVMLTEIEEIATARHILGEAAIIGFDCGNSKEKAEITLKSGVDYVSFSTFFASASAKKYADISLLEWWSSATHLPAVAFSKLDVERSIKLAKAGAGFIGANSWVWEHDEGVKQAIYWLQESIEHGLSQVQIN
ncbi:MAG: thiamine phosphate synthase [Rickettsiales bacterium]